MEQVTEIFDTHQQCFVEALILDIQERHVRDFEEIWLPQLEELSEEDKHLDWALKKRLSRNYDDFEVYALEYNNMAQGFIAIETLGHRSWFDTSASLSADETQRIVYAKFIVSAPWNRRVSGTLHYKYVGLKLLLFVRQRSLALGYAGRVGLHSLPGAVGFYRKAGMLELGNDPDRENLTYFEYRGLS